MAGRSAQPIRPAPNTSTPLMTNTRGIPMTAPNRPARPIELRVAVSITVLIPPLTRPICSFGTTS
jgi:hypothetical protein